MKTQENNLASASIPKLLLSLALPAVTAQIVNLLYNMVDRMYIGHIENIGAVALTGLGVATPIIIIVSAFSSLIGMGGAPRAAIMMGKKENETAEEILGNCVTALFIISLILTAVFIAFSKPLLMMFGGSETTLPYAQSYLSVYACGTIFVQFALGLNMFITTQGFAKTSMLTVIIGACLNIILDPIFIFGFGMGVRGAALATIISQAVSAVWVVSFLCGKKTNLKIRKKYLRPKLNVILPVLALGVSPFIMQSTESLLSVCFNTSLLKYGSDVTVGAMTVISSTAQIAMLPLVGMSQGAQPIISYNFGAKNIDRVKQTFKLLFIISVAFSTVFWLLIQLAPQVFVKIFTNDAELVKTTVWAIRIYAAVLCLQGIQIACQQTFVALGNAKYSLFLALLRKIILLIPLIYILPAMIADKLFAVFLAEPVADFMAVSITAIVFFTQFYKLCKTIKDNN